MSHSAGQIRPKRNNVHDTAKHAPAKDIHTSTANGDMKENVDGASFLGFRYRIEIPLERNVCDVDVIAQG